MTERDNREVVRLMEAEREFHHFLRFFLMTPSLKHKKLDIVESSGDMVCHIHSRKRRERFEFSNIIIKSNYKSVVMTTDPTVCNKKIQQV